MSKWIEIDTALLKTVSVGGLSAKALWKRIMQQPSIDIVRCKDCIVFRTHGKNTDICPMWHNTHIDPCRDFCSRGKRREP